MSYSTVWCFTINNPSDNEIPKEWLGVKDAVWQLEEGEAGTPHLQGFVRFTERKRLSALKKVNSTAHWEPAKDPKASVAYCSKESTRVDGPWTIGTPQATQGTRKDIELGVEMARLGVPIEDIIDKYPALVRVTPHLKSHLVACRIREEKRQRREVKVNAPLRPWQQELADMLDLPPDGRHFLYLFEVTGNVGKSWIASYFQLVRGAFLTRPGRLADMAHAYQMEPIVVLDVSRTTVEGAVANTYAFAECLLDGTIFSPKYDSVVKVFKPPHVVIFSNDAPDFSKMSKDRYMAYEIINETLVAYEEPANMVGVHPDQIRYNM